MQGQFRKTFACAAPGPPIWPDRALPRYNRIKTMLVYYDKFGLCDHARLLAKVSSALPAVLLTENLICSEVIDSS